MPGLSWGWGDGGRQVQRPKGTTHSQRGGAGGETASAGDLATKRARRSEEFRHCPRGHHTGVTYRENDQSRSSLLPLRGNLNVDRCCSCSDSLLGAAPVTP